MRGFLWKDIELLKQNRSVAGIVLIMTIFMICVKNESFIVIYLAMMGGFVAMSTISYDEADHGMGFLMTLPSDRKTYVKEKYILGYGLSFSLFFVGIVLSRVIGMLRGGTMERGEWLITCLFGILIIAVAMVVLIPVQLKFGSDNGRIVMASVFLGIFGTIYLIAKVLGTFGIDIDTVLDEVRNFEIGVSALGIFIFLLLASYISGKISVHIMKRKEF